MVTNLICKEPQIRDNYSIDELGKLFASMVDEHRKIEHFPGGLGSTCSAFGFRFGKAILRNEYKSKDLIDAANAFGADIKHTHDATLTYGVNLYEMIERQLFGMKFISSGFSTISSNNEDLNNNYVKKVSPSYRSLVTAIKTKPFILLAGISGTGKSRVVRELARSCWEKESNEYICQRPRNFEMIQVKPNWHDSSELIGYVSRVSGTPIYVAGVFLKFIIRAWENMGIPHFLCLDEMNLAPVEQYFAEYLSVLESRKLQNVQGVVVTDPLLKKSNDDWYKELICELTNDGNLRNRFLEEGICLPPNLVVVGTVNMDETTFSFSRKVLDRAMTIEMNEVDLFGGLENKFEFIGKLDDNKLIGTSVEGVDVYVNNKAVCNIVLNYLKTVNETLAGTSFMVAYRTRNEFLLYVVNNLPYTEDLDGNVLSQEQVIARSLDEITSMKILSRIEGDETKVSRQFLSDLAEVISGSLKAIGGEKALEFTVSTNKIEEMKNRLSSGYTSFWN